MHAKIALFALVVGVGFAPTRVAAVIVAGGDGTQNTSAPADDPGWSYVGVVGSATGVYLGNYGGGYWAVTASHVGAGNLTLGATSYTYVPGSAVQIRNGDNSTTDLTLFRIATSPGLPNLTLATTAPITGSSVITIGHGVNRDAAISYWSVNNNGNVSGATSGTPWTWTLLPDATGANASGYFWASGSTMRYGANVIAGTTTFDVGTGPTAGLYATFDAIAGESQGATGDSGGAVFFKNGATWELAGIMSAISGYNNQPSSTAVFGTGEVTFYSNIANYNSAIFAAIPEPASVAAWLGAVIGLAAFGLRRGVGRNRS